LPAPRWTSRPAPCLSMKGDKPRIGQAFWPSIGGAGRQRSLQGPL
jgi:hypothetical protein